MRLSELLFGSLTRDEAIALARAECERHDWPWTEPIRASRQPFGGYHVMTNTSMRGGNVNVHISRGGRVARAAFARR